MRPFLFSIGHSYVPSFFFFIMFATLAGTFYLYGFAKKRGFAPEVILDMGILGIIFGVLGSRIFHILVEAPDYYWEKPMRVFEFWRGGFVSWGGFFGAILSYLVYFRIRKLPALVYFDLAMIGMPIVKFFIRLACLLTGCCYGKPTNVPWAITFTHPSSTAYYYFPDMPLHPTQIYSMIHAVFLFVFVQWYYKRNHGSPGKTTCAFLMAWAIPRAFVEVFRADSDRGLFFGNLLSTGQITSAVLFLLGLLGYGYLRQKEKSHA